MRRGLLSRRRVLKMTLGSAALIVGGGLDTAGTQSIRRIEQYDPELEAILSTSEAIEELGTGYGVAGSPAEGPVWVAEGGYLLFNSMQASQRLKYSPGQGVAVAMDKTNGANGMTRDLQRRLISAERDTAREPDRSGRQHYGCS